MPPRPAPPDPAPGAPAPPGRALSLVPFLALRHVRRRGLQSALTVAGVAVGVAVLIIALSLTNGFIAELIDSTLQATPHVTLASYDGSRLREDAEVLAALAAEERVVAVAPFLQAQALIARRADATRGISGRSGFTQVVGVDPDLEREVLDLPALDAAAPALREGEGIVLGDTLGARTLGVFEGDRVLLRDIDGRSATLEVASLFRVGNELIDGVASFMAIPALQDFLRAEGEISGYHVRVADPERASDIGLELAREYGLRAVSWESLFSSLVEQLRLQKALISAVTFLIVLVAAMGIANILVLTVAEKTEDIAILRALGASERQVLATFMLEGLVLGGAGTVLGALLGLGVAALFVLRPYPLPGDLYFITRLPVQVQALDVLWVCGVSLATSVLAGVLPARRAARLEPVRILR